MHTHTHNYIYIFVYTNTHTYVCKYIYTYNLYFNISVHNVAHLTRRKTQVKSAYNKYAYM